MTGTTLADFALNAEKGPLSKQYGNSRSEREGLHALFVGGFKLFRNPSAHRVMDFGVIEAKFIVGYVNLLLNLLNQITANQPDSPFPENVENGLAELEKSIDSASAIRFRTFLSKCGKLGLTPKSSSKKWIAFGQQARVKQPNWEKPKPHSVAIFYFYSEPGQQNLWFPVNQYYAGIVGFERNWVIEQLRALGFRQTGQHQDLTIPLKHHTSEAFLSSLLEVVEKIAAAFKATL